MTSAATTGAHALPGALTPARWRLPALFVLTLAYVLSGKLGLLLAIPPGYATAIFPPAGIAASAVLVAGASTLPWIFAGSLILNLWVGFDAANQANVIGIEAALLIAAVSTLQAAIGGTVLRRALGWPAAMDHEKPLGQFVLLTPLICLISASGSIFGLKSLGLISEDSIVSSWITWWIGDSLGVLVMLPLCLILTGEPRALWRSRAAPVGLPIVIGLILFVVIFVRFSAWERGQSLLEFNMISQQVSDRVQMRLEAQEVLLEQAEGFLGGDEPVTRESFKRYIEKTLVRYPMVKAMEWVPRVTAVERSDYESHHGLEIREFPNNSLRSRRALDRAVHYPITFIEPQFGNETVLGFDWVTRIGLPALNAATRAQRAFITAPMQLIQDKGRANASPGVLIISPVRGGANGPGFVASVLRVHEFIESALPAAADQLSLRLIDTDAKSFLYDSIGNAEAVFETELNFGGRHYLFQTIPTPAYLQTHRAWQSWGVLVLGLIFIALLASALLLSTGNAARTDALVIARTADLRDEKYFSETVINSLPGVFYMLDETGAVVQWNRTFKKVFGKNDEEIRVGDILQTTMREDRSLASDAIRRVFVTRGYAETELRQRVANGEMRRYLVSGQYIEIAGKPYLVGTGIDVTERREMEQEVQRGRKVLRTLIDAAPAWITMIDREGRMVIANRRYSETFGLQPAFIEGKHYSAVLPTETSIRLESLFDQCFAGKQMEFDDEWNVRRQATMFVHGKCVPIFEGDKVVSIVMAIMDLTEIQNAQSRLRSANAELERRVEEIRALQTMLQEQAIRDPLSGLYNRRYLDETLERELARAQREGYPVSIVMGDIDHFKKLNDTYGHQAGDEVIRMAARSLREQARTSDILCRFGGEEFLLVLPGMAPSHAIERVNAWRQKFSEERLSFGGFKLSATMSFGISSYPAHGQTPELLISAADQALYLAKKNGRNRVEHSPI
ncbi:hypothetical protein CJD38_10050 [Stenotrophobium rhamnosiphilum]|uniref:diguanylate cyclase n=1 Tax=Stenotrophobium rhamnosiphilum TaxID=2029166 RepID=A0A2T5MGG0_9GAMM|nr:hypothetical protein CJD38_10050 [Stenotrophobium rhamnosiphilum]